MMCSIMMRPMRLLVLLLAFVAAAAQAHTVPSLTIEAVFQADHSYTLRINVDPRLFLSTQPTSLPPVEAKWYRDQSPDELKKTEQQAADYLKRAVSLLFAAKPAELPVITFKPMDGATNEPLAAESKEIHLLAEMHGMVTAPDFQIAISKDANSSVILLNSLGDQMERRPQVLFPGETSRAFALVAKK
jgi:hypothetical protein